MFLSNASGSVLDFPKTKTVSFWVSEAVHTTFGWLQCFSVAWFELSLKRARGDAFTRILFLNVTVATNWSVRRSAGVW